MLKKFTENFLKNALKEFDFSSDDGGISRSFKKRKLPGFIVSVTTRCNFSCPHCLRTEIDQKKTKVRDLPLAVFDTVLAQGKRLDFQHVSFTGGEPILHPQFSELVALAVKYGYRYNFVSNGWFYKDYWEIIKQFRNNLENIFLSLDGATADVHDAVRNKPGSFKRQLEAIRFFRSQNLPMSIVFCVTERNRHQIGMVPDLCLKEGIESIKWTTSISVYDSSGNPSSEYVFDAEERTDIFQKIMVMKERYKNRRLFKICNAFLPVSNDSKPEIRARKNNHFCSILADVGQGMLYIDHDGGMFFCCDLNREYQNKPLIAELGFEKSLRITLNSANEMKKKILSVRLNGQKIGRLCDFCANNIKNCLDIAIQQEQ